MRSLSSSILVSVATISALLGCAMPLCALAAAAAFLVPRRYAAVIVAFAWAFNQVLGFTIHGYPHTRETLAWGVAIGIAGFVSLWIARLVTAKRPDLGLAALSLVAAFGAFEATLVCASVFLGGWRSYSVPIVAQLFCVNALWFVGIVVVVMAIQRLRLLSPV